MSYRKIIITKGQGINLGEDQYVGGGSKQIKKKRKVKPRSEGYYTRENIQDRKFSNLRKLSKIKRGDTLNGET